MWVDDLHAFYRQWIDGEPGPHVVIAHSMGGHILSRALSAHVIRPDAAVMIAPMLGLNSGILPARFAGPVARLMCALGDPARAAWKNVERPGIGSSLRQALLTHSAERYSDEIYWQEHMPQLKLGPPSWQWLNAAYRSLAMLESPGTLENINTPLLILAAERDGLVDTQAIRRAAKRIGGARLHVYGPEAAHEILREADAVRSDALHRIDAFLDDAAPRQ
jgi:lysophospholipase